MLASDTHPSHRLAVQIPSSQSYTEVDDTPPLPSTVRLRSTDVSIPEASQEGPFRSTPISRCFSMDSPSAATAVPGPATAAPRSSTCASAPGALPAMPQWESWNAERNSSRRGHLPRESGLLSRQCRSEDGSNGSEEMTTIAGETRSRIESLNAAHASNERLQDTHLCEADTALQAR